MGTAGFSLRQSLLEQGVTTEEATKEHLQFVFETLKINPAMRVTRYRVNRSLPNVIYHG